MCNNWSLKSSLCQVRIHNRSYTVLFYPRSGRCDHNKNCCWKHPQEGRWGVQPPWPGAGCGHNGGERFTELIVPFAISYRVLTTFQPCFSFNNGENCLEKACEGSALFMWRSEDIAQICDSVSTSPCSLGVCLPAALPYANIKWR